MLLLGLGFLGLVSAAQADQSQLNIAGFARCLSREAPAFDLAQIQRRYALAEGDRFLVYLSLYPGKRIPLLESLQDEALQRWEFAWDLSERDLLARIAATSGPLTPGRVYRLALQSSLPGDIFGASLLVHNVFRTLGRHDHAFAKDFLSGEVTDLNPAWFREDPAKYSAFAEALRERLIPLRRDGEGDRFGEWYHFFGILTYSIHELARTTDLGDVDLAVKLTELLNPILAGGAEEPEKAQLDRDAVEVAWMYLKDLVLLRSGSCEDATGYVAR